MHDSMEAVCVIASSPSLSSCPSPRSAGASTERRAEATAGTPWAGVRGEEALDGEEGETGDTDDAGDPEGAEGAGAAAEAVALVADTVDLRALSSVGSRRRVSPSWAGPTIGSSADSAWKPSGGVRRAWSAASLGRAGTPATPGTRSTAAGLVATGAVRTGS